MSLCIALTRFVSASKAVRDCLNRLETVPRRPTQADRPPYRLGILSRLPNRQTGRHAGLGNYLDAPLGRQRTQCRLGRLPTRSQKAVSGRHAVSGHDFGGTKQHQRLPDRLGNLPTRPKRRGGHHGRFREPKPGTWGAMRYVGRPSICSLTASQRLWQIKMRFRRVGSRGGPISRRADSADSARVGSRAEPETPIPRRSRGESIPPIPPARVNAKLGAWRAPPSENQARRSTDRTRRIGTSTDETGPRATPGL